MQVLQSASVAKGKCCKGQVLQSASVAKYCTMHIALYTQLKQIASVENCKCCKLQVLQGLKTFKHVMDGRTGGLLELLFQLKTNLRMDLHIVY